MYEDTACTCVKVRISVHAADSDISIELLYMLRKKVQEMRDQLALVQLSGDVTEVTDIKPTSSTQSMLTLIMLLRLMFMFVYTAATMRTQSRVCVKEEPMEEVLPSAAVYSACMCIGRV